MNCFKTLGNELLPQTQDHLYEYIFEYYKKLILLKEWSKAG
ncbi:hypothetical protein JCM19298_1874 [Nonlabens ulvanivorans]|nr:hypothetical protein JCM19298_1874 [Nonlabens ulvanivorans]